MANFKENTLVTGHGGVTHLKINSLVNVMLSPHLKLLQHNGKRPNKSTDLVRNELIEYLKQEAAKRHFPTKRELQRQFHLRLDVSIKELYELAGLAYIQKNNQALKQKKAKMLLNMVIDLLPKLRLKFVYAADVTEKGVDIIALNESRRLVGIEIKAYHKNEPVKERNITQLKRFLNEGFDEIILITTATHFEIKTPLPGKIKILTFNDIKQLANNEQMKILEQIREESVHVETEDKARNKLRIINYAQKRLNEGIEVGRIYDDILRDLRLDLYTYFKSTSDLLAQIPNLPLSIIFRSGRISRKNPEINASLKERAIHSILNYMSKEVQNGHYPCGKDIERVFGISHIWNFITMTELYHVLGQPAYLERETRRQQKESKDCRN